MSDKALLEEIRENRVYATNEWQAIRAEAKKDRLCVAGKAWQALDPQGVRDRKSNKRPFLEMDELSQYTNQTVNDVRANPRAIKFAPTGNGANDQGAEFYQNHTREIEYRSHARVAYARAFENSVISGYGWVRVRTQREHLRTFNQDLYIDPVVNADQVLADPSAVWPDSRDIKFLYYIEPWAKAEYRRRFPKAKVRDFTTDWRKVASQWFDGENIHVAEYWRFETVRRRLVAFQRPGSDAPEMALVHELPDGKLPDGVENLRDEEVDDSEVQSYLTNGIEILKQQPWKGKFIPFASCMGRVIYVDEGDGSRRQILSMTRLARDPQMVYNYMWTCESEAVGGIPRATWVGYEGQFAKPDTWRKANHQPVAFLEGKVSVPGNPTTTPLPLPHKEPWDPPLQNLEMAKEAARRAIQSAMGITPLPTPVQRENQKSGAALDKISSSTQRGSFHFVDGYELMIERVGVILEDLMDKTLDTARDVPVRKPDDSAMVVRINDPNDPQAIFTKGDYRVTVTTGPATESQRQEGADFVDSMLSNIGTIEQVAGPQKAAMLLAKAVKLKQLGPIGDEIIELLTPPEIKGKDGKPLPPEAQALAAQVQQLQGQLQKATQLLQGRTVEKQTEMAGKFQIAKMQEDAETSRAADDREVKMVVAELGAKVDRMALLLEASKVIGVQLDAEATRAHDASESAKARAHTSIEGVKDRVHARVTGEVAHTHDLEAAEQGVAGQIAVQAAAPESTNGTGGDSGGGE